MADPFRANRTKTKELFSEAMEDNWSSARQMVANVFNAYFMRSLTADQIIGVAKLMDSLSADGDKYVLDAISYFVRKKVLRTRKGHRGKKLFEVNY